MAAGRKIRQRRGSVNGGEGMGKVDPCCVVFLFLTQPTLQFHPWTVLCTQTRVC